MQGFRPQPGRQTEFLSTRADIAIYGGAAAGGKTYALLLEALRHTGNGKFGAVIFRRQGTQVTGEGGLWDTAMQIYPAIGGAPRMSPRLQFQFPSGAKISFAHLQYETDVLGWQGSQIPLVCFDELTHFERGQFFYMLSRNRSACGVRPYVRATCNPDADSWVAEFIAWWLDDDGFPIPERAGRLRWFTRINDAIYWADSPEALADLTGCSPDDAKSVTFIPSRITDNPALLSKDPGYMANLKALPMVERARLLDGNWKIRPAAGLVFPRHNANLIQAIPADWNITWVRAWDLAATPISEANKSPDATAGVKIGRTQEGRYVVADVRHLRADAHKVRQAIRATAEHDGAACRISLPQDPGQAGKDQAASLTRMLAGFSVYASRPTGSKVTRAEPFSAQWQAGNVDILRGPWTDAFLNELEGFPDAAHDDLVDAAADAFAALQWAASTPDYSRSAGIYRGVAA